MPQPNHWVGDAETEDYLTLPQRAVPGGATRASSTPSAAGATATRWRPASTGARSQFTQTWPQIYPLGFLPLIETDGDRRLGDARRARHEERVVLGPVAPVRPQRAWTSTSRTPSTRRSVPTFRRTRPSSTRARSSADQLLANLDFSREFEVGLAGPLNVAFGAEFRREGYQIEAGEPDSYLDGGVPAIERRARGPRRAGLSRLPAVQRGRRLRATTSRSTSTSRATSEPRARRAWPGASSTTATSAATVDGKLTVRIQAHERLVLRGAASTGFRAPSLAQSNFSAVSTNFINIPGRARCPVEVGTFAVSEPGGARARRHRPQARGVGPPQRRARLDARPTASTSPPTTTTSRSTTASCSPATSRAARSARSWRRSARPARASSRTRSTPGPPAST